MDQGEVVMFSLDEIDFDTQLDLLPWAQREEDEALATALQALDRMDAPN